MIEKYLMKFESTYLNYFHSCQQPSSTNISVLQRGTESLFGALYCIQITYSIIPVLTFKMTNEMYLPL